MADDLNNVFILPVLGSPRFDSNVVKCLATLRESLGAGGNPSFGTILLQDATASRLISTDSNKKLSSVLDLTEWIAGTTNRVTVADDSDGTVTLSAPQDLHTGASFEVADLTLNTGGIILPVGQAISATSGSAELRFDNNSPQAVSISATDSNTIGVFRVYPNGSPATDFKTAMQFFTTDFAADQANYEVLTIWAYNDSYRINSGAGGTGSNRPIWIHTSGNHPQLALHTDGTVGIGTITPGAKLEVAGNALVNQDADGLGLYIDSEATTLTNYGLKVETGAGACAAYIAYGAAANGSAYLGLPPNNSNYASFLFARDLAAANTDCAVAYFLQDNAGDDQPVVEIKQDGSGACLAAGDGTNYITVASDGTVSLVGTARVTHEIELQAVDFNPGASGPTSALHGAYPSYEFTIGDDIYTVFEIPDDWDSSTAVTVSVYWAINEAYATNSGEVQWSAPWTAVAVGEDITSPTHTGTIDFGDVDIPAATNVLVKTSGTIVAASLAAGDLVSLHVSRVALDDGANPTAEPYIVRIEIEYTANLLGG